MKEKIKSYFENLGPKQLGLKSTIKVTSVSKLGMGTSNLNYKVIANKRPFVFRLNMELGKKRKSRKEFEALKIVKKYNLSPIPWVLDESRKDFDSDLQILSFIEGVTSNKSPDYLKPKMVRKLGELCGKLHSIKINGSLTKLDDENLKRGYKQQRLFLENEYLDYINKNLNSEELKEIIKVSFKSLEIPLKNYKPDPVLSQGDFCEQNIVVNKGKYKLIDFEDLETTDRASHLAHIFTDFGKPLNNDQKELFLKEYFKLNKLDKKKLTKEIDVWIPIKIFTIFLWSIHHTLKIQNKEMHPDFLKQNDFTKNIDYAKTMFKRCLEFGVINKKYSRFKIEDAFK